MGGRSSSCRFISPHCPFNLQGMPARDRKHCEFWTNSMFPTLHPRTCSGLISGFNQAGLNLHIATQIRSPYAHRYQHPSPAPQWWSQRSLDQSKSPANQMIASHSPHHSLSTSFLQRHATPPLLLLNSTSTALALLESSIPGPYSRSALLSEALTHSCPSTMPSQEFHPSTSFRQAGNQTESTVG